MSNKIIRIVTKIIIILFIFQIVSVPVVKAGYWSDIISSGNDFIKDGKNEAEDDKVIDGEKLGEINGRIYNVLLALGVVLSVIVGAILGIQMMWGSIEQQAKAKEMLMPYGIGCVVIFGAFGIWKLCVTIFSQL